MKIKGFAENEMLIGGWVAPPYSENPEENFVTEKAFLDIKKSGINAVYTDGSRAENFADIRRASECAAKAGVKLIVGADCLRNGLLSDFECRNFLKLCRESESIAGLNIFDEPGTNSFGMIKELKEKFADELGELLFYVNLLPMYATPAQLKGGWWTPDESRSEQNEYAVYVKEYLETVNPAVLSFDFYPFRHEKGVCDGEYFTQLSICASLVKEAAIPLWNFIQVTSWNRDCIRNTTYSEISWQVAASIAYGVTGIQYFCCWTPSDAGGEKFLSAMIDKTGKPTKSYYFVEKINRHLRSIQGHLLSAKHEGVIAFGDTLSPVPRKDNLIKYGRISEIDAEGLLIGCFRRGEKFMYYVVNTSVFEERTSTLSFSSETKFRLVRDDYSCEFSADRFTEVLHPGEGVLLVEC